VTRISDFWKFRSSRLRGFFSPLAMKECDGRRRGCWAYAAQRPGFSIVEVLFIHKLCSRRKILAVPHTSNAPRRGVLRSQLIRRRAPRPTHSIMYVPLQVNRFQKSVLLIVEYKYLKSCSGDFYSPESDPPHKIMRYWFYCSI